MAKPKKTGRGPKARSASASKKTGRSVKRQTRRKPAKRAPSRRVKPAVTHTARRTKTAKKAVKKAAVKKAVRTVEKKVAGTVVKKKAGALRKAAEKPTQAAPARRNAPAPPPVGPDKRPRLDRERRILDETSRTPPSSLDMDRRGSAVRTGRAEMAEHLADHGTLTPDITAGDVDVNVEDAYFTGDESPGGDNSTPDQDVVDEIGKALGVEYDEGESLKGSDKVTERDKHRWELDPASAEDFRDRK